MKMFLVEFNLETILTILLIIKNLHTIWERKWKNKSLLKISQIKGKNQWSKVFHWLSSQPIQNMNLNSIDNLLNTYTHLYVCNLNFPNKFCLLHNNT